jgi:peptide/nickel transport system substrate-binding protein
MVVTTAGSDQVKIQTERATPVIEAVLAEFAFVIFLKKNGKYLFTGPYAVETFDAGKYIDLIPNTYYPRASERPLVKIQKYDSGQALASALSKSEVDMAFHLPVDELEALRKISGITIKTFAVEYMYMMWHNMRRSPLSDKDVRKAVDIALDRNVMTQTLKGGTGTRSFFPPDTPYSLLNSGLGSLNADKNGAGKLLTDAGWILTNGKRMKDGKALTLKLVAYPQRPGLVTVQPEIAKTLEGLGITVNQVVTSGASWDELDNLMAAKDYDLLCWAQNTLPAGDSQYFMNAFFRSSGGSNHAGLNSTNVDNLLDALSTAASGDARIKASADAQKAILGLVPVSMWMAPAWHVGLSSRMASYVPWGSDYYIIHDFLFLPATTTTIKATTATKATTTEAKENDASSSYRAMVNAFLVASLWFMKLVV